MRGTRLTIGLFRRLDCRTVRTGTTLPTYLLRHWHECPGRVQTDTDTPLIGWPSLRWKGGRSFLPVTMPVFFARSLLVASALALALVLACGDDDPALVVAETPVPTPVAPAPSPPPRIANPDSRSHSEPQLTHPNSDAGPAPDASARDRPNSGFRDHQGRAATEGSGSGPRRADRAAQAGPRIAPSTGPG